MRRKQPPCASRKLPSLADQCITQWPASLRSAGVSQRVNASALAAMPLSRCSERQERRQRTPGSGGDGQLDDLSAGAARHLRQWIRRELCLHVSTRATCVMD